MCKLLGVGFTQRNVKDAAAVVKEALSRLGGGVSERLVISEVEAEYQVAWGLDFVKAVVDTVSQLAAEVVERGEAEVVLQWSRRLSVLTQVLCSGWRADVICLASGGQCQISAKARKVGELRQVKLSSMLKKRVKVVIARADYVSSWPVVKHRLAGGEVVGVSGTLYGVYTG